MTEYQLLYLRFLQLKRDYPELNHKGHEIEAEREFYRLEPRPSIDKLEAELEAESKKWGWAYK